MKYIRPREAAPLWVWLSLSLIALAIAAYLVSFIMIEELFAFRT